MHAGPDSLAGLRGFPRAAPLPTKPGDPFSCSSCTGLGPQDTHSAFRPLAGLPTRSPHKPCYVFNEPKSLTWGLCMAAAAVAHCLHCCCLCYRCQATHTQST